MAQVMDPTQASCQIQLLTELHSRFPEVPVEVIKIIMHQSYYNRECCIEMLAKECQKYQNMLYNKTVTPSPRARHSTEDLWRQQHYDSAESMSSVSSGHSGGALPSFEQTSPAGAHSLMRSSQSYPYIPPSETSGRVHDPMPRSSLPMASLDVLAPSQHFRAVDGGIPATAAIMQYGPFSFRADTQFGQHNALRQDGRVDLGRNLPSYNLPGGSPSVVRATETMKQKTITSGVSYKVNCVANTAEPSKPMYLSATHVNMLPAEERGGMLGASAHEASEKSQNRLSDSSLSTLSTNRSSNALYINPQQAWVSGMQMPTTHISLLSSSSSCECLPTVTCGSQTPVCPSSSCIPANSASALPSLHNSNSPRLTSESEENPEYAKALRVCQTVNFDKMSRKHQEFVQYCNELRPCIAMMEAELTHRLLQRSQAFPTSEDVEKLKRENRKLRIDIQLLTREIDLADNGQMPLGVLDPAEQRDFIRRDSYRRRSVPRTTSEGSACVSVTSPVTPQLDVTSPVPYMPQVPPPSEALSSSQQSDDTEGDSWNCSACTFLNHPALKQCECCEMPRLPT